MSAEQPREARLPASIWWIALAVLILRWVLLAGLNLYSDEAYYWTWSLHPAWGYYDHPPMVAWLIRIATTVLTGETGVRAAFLICGAGTVVVAAAIAGAVSPDGRAPIAAALFAAAAPMLTLTGALALPDAPQELFYALAVWCLVRTPRRWLLGGLFWGLALQSKYSAALLGPEVLLVLLIDCDLRADFRSLRPWAGGVLAAVVFLPCILWNAERGWVSFRFQLEHGFGSGASLRSFGEFLAAVLAGSGFLVFPIAAVFFFRVRTTAARLLMVSALGPLALVTWSATRGHVEANWPAVSYPPLCAAAAVEIARWRVAWRRSALVFTSVLGLGAAVLFAREVRAPHWLDPGSTLVTRLHGWKDLAGDIVAASEGATYVEPATYQLAAELAWYAGWRHFGPTFRRVSQFNFWAEPPAPGEKTIIVSEGQLSTQERAHFHADPARPDVEVQTLFDGKVIRRVWITVLNDESKPESATRDSGRVPAEKIGASEKSHEPIPVHGP